jgi:hypothetical protein
MGTEEIKHLTVAGLRKRIAALEAENAALREASLDAIAAVDQMYELGRDDGSAWGALCQATRKIKAALANEPSGMVPVDRERLREGFELMVILIENGANPLQRIASFADWLARLIGEEGKDAD